MKGSIDMIISSTSSNYYQAGLHTHPSIFKKTDDFLDEWTFILTTLFPHRNPGQNDADRDESKTGRNNQ